MILSDDFAPLLSAILADGPGSVAVAADWLEDRGLLTPQDVRPAVLAHPNPDGPRLLYARACEREGQTERAEFVRVQLELARPSKCATCSGRRWYELNDRQSEDCLYCTAALRRRERELLFGRSDSRGTYSVDARIRWSGSVWLQVIEWEYRRGFVELIRCRFDEWSAHAAAIRAEHPVREVRLATWPHEYDNQFSQRGIPEIVRQGLAVHWPGIAFVLPSRGARIGTEAVRWTASNLATDRIHLW